MSAELPRLFRFIDTCHSVIGAMSGLYCYLDFVLLLDKIDRMGLDSNGPLGLHFLN